MPDEIPQTAAPPPVAPATIEPTAPASSAGVSVSEPVVTAETPAEAPVVEPEAPVPAPSLLSDATTIEPTAAPPAPEEPKAAEPPPAPVVPTYEPFTFPEGMNADEATLNRYTDVLGKYGISQEAGQDLVNFHTAELKRAADAAVEHQQQVFDETQQGWVREVRADLGARFDTTLREAAFGRDAVLLNPAFGGSPELLQSFRSLIDYSGVGNNVTFIKAFAAIGRALAEPAAPREQATPPADRGLGRSRAASRYPNMPGTNGAG